MIPEDHKSDVMRTGMEFMRAITEAYGAEEGMKLWDTISSTLDPDVKGQIFFAMLCGDFGDVIHIRAIRALGPTYQAVPIIKAIRTATGMGLKEAKDLYDGVKVGRPAKIKVHANDRTGFVAELRQQGCII